MIDLDDIVLCSPPESGAALGSSIEHTPDTDFAWRDDDQHRFTLWNAELQPYKPMAGDIYFTDVNQLRPQPSGAVVLDHPSFTRLITRGNWVFNVFEARTPRGQPFADYLIGARMGQGWTSTCNSPLFTYDPEYSGFSANDTHTSVVKIGNTATMVLRCCGQRDGRELFRVVQYVPAWFDFNPSSPPKNTAAISPPVPASIALAEIRSSLINAAKRWNGDDDVNPHQAIFEVGPADNPTAVGPLHAILVRGVDGDQTYKYKIAIVASVRAFMATECAWERDNMQVGAGGKFTAAHEWGHAFGNPDHYVETSRNASLWARGIRDIARSPGCPYEFDAKGMMNGEELRPRCYDMWHLALWMADADGSFAGAINMAIRQGPYRYTTTVTPRTRDRSRFPVITRNAIQVGAVGLCDLFAYAPGSMDSTVATVSMALHSSRQQTCL